MPEKLYSIQEVSASLGVCDETIRNWIRTGKIEAKKMPNRTYRIEQSALDKVLT